MERKFTNFNKNTEKTNKEPLKKIKTYIHKDNVVYENNESLLIKTNKGYFWTSKKGIFTSNYTNKLTVYLVKDWKYDLLNQEYQVITKLNSEELVEIINESN